MRELQQALTGATSAEQVLALCAAHADTFDHIHAATALNRLGVFCGTAAARHALVDDARAHSLTKVLPLSLVFVAALTLTLYAPASCCSCVPPS